MLVSKLKPSPFTHLSRTLPHVAPEKGTPSVSALASICIISSAYKTSASIYLSSYNPLTSVQRSHLPARSSLQPPCFHRDVPTHELAEECGQMQLRGRFGVIRQAPGGAVAASLPTLLWVVRAWGMPSALWLFFQSSQRFFLWWFSCISLYLAQCLAHSRHSIKSTGIEPATKFNPSAAHHTHSVYPLSHQRNVCASWLCKANTVPPKTI